MSTREGDDEFAVAPTQNADTHVADTSVDTRPRGRAARLSLPGYEVGQTIGVGGMGEVLLAHDPDIGRDVAVKRMRAAAPRPDEVARFLREARIQARLDHPAIVPVHALGTDSAGMPYFTMKRLAGATLADGLDTHAQPLPRLLRAFVEVCLAIDFAHARGVVHRDLKPSNIVLGDYGEVYVLDWGIARVLADAEADADPRSKIPTYDGKTEAGALLGTPGYMPPEQACGEPDVGPPADVYALGAILFEVLTGAPLHPRGATAIASTLATPTHSPATRAPERAIAPELDAACTAALAAAPADRPTARVLADLLQRYLDGDRDVAHRRALAAESLASARVAAADPARRADAMRDAGRALALDPASTDAAALVSKLMLEPPPELPPALVARLRQVDDAEALRSARIGSVAILAYFLAVPLALWTGITDVPLFVGFYALVALIAGVAAWQWRTQRNNDIVPLLLNGVMLAVMSRTLGEFVLVPAVLAAVMIGLAAQPQLIGRLWLVLAVAVGTMAVPLALEAAGVIARTWDFRDGHLVLSSSVLRLEGAAASAFLIATNVAMTVAVTVFGRTIVAGRRTAQHTSEIQAWHLRQLLPQDPA